MDLIFEKDSNNTIIPIFKSKLNKSNFMNFINNLRKLKSKEFINCLFEIIKKSEEIGQILLDIHEIYKIDGIIEILIEKYINNDEDTISLNNFFIYISNNYEIGKHIYDSIYRIIGKLFRTSLNPLNKLDIIEKTEYEKRLIFEKCVDLLIIFYNKYDNYKKIMKDNYFYLYNNEIKTKITQDNSIKLKNNYINFYMFIHINEFYENKESIIINIKFNNNTELIIKLIDKKYIEIYYQLSKLENKENIQLKNWNNIQIKINNDKFIILLNNKILNENNIKVNEIIELSFYKNFHGIISPIIISDNEFEIKEYFSKQFINDLITDFISKTQHVKHKKNIEKNIEQYYDNIPIVLTLLKNKNNNSFESIIRNNIITKNNFPYFYSFIYKNMKENIFLLGGVQNILPLFEIIYKLYKEDETINKILKKIIQLLGIIFSSENNIDDGINSNFFEIFSLFIEKLSKYDNNIIPQIKIIIEQLIKRKKNNDNMYLDFKNFFLNGEIIKNLSEKGKDLYFEFLIQQKYKREVFLFLLTFLIKNKDINNLFLDKIFDFFFKYLDTENPEAIGEICLLLNSNEINNNIIKRLLDLLIKLLNINVEKDIIENILFEQQRVILQSLTFKQIKMKDESEIENEKIKNIQNNINRNNQNKVKDLEKKIVKKVKNFSYLLKNNLMQFCFKLSNSNDIEIKLKLISLLQIIFYYYINTNEDLSEYNQNNLLYQLEKIERGETQKNNQQIENYDVKLDNLEKSLTHNFYNQIKIFPEINNNNNDDEEIIKKQNIFEMIINDFIDIITISMKLDFEKNQIKNLINSEQQILIFIRDFLSLVNNLHFINLESSKFNLISFSNITYILNVRHRRVVYPKYFDLYQIFSFTKIIIPLIYHIFLLNDINNNEILNEIHEYIFTIIFEIYLNSINVGLSNFIFFINELDWYINEQKNNDIFNYNEKLLNSFTTFFFQKIIQKISSFEELYFEINGKEKKIFIIKFKKAIIGNKEFDINFLYNIIIKFQKKNNFKNFILSLGYQNFDYLIIKEFLLYFEIFLINPKNLDLFIEDYIFLIIFCILLCTNEIEESYSKSNKKKFFVEIVLLTIKSIFLYLIHKFDSIFIQIFILFMSIISYLMEHKQLFSFDIFIKEKGIENNFKKFLSLFNKFYGEKKLNNYYEKIIEIIIENRDNIIFLQNPLITKNESGVRFEIIIEKIFSHKSKLEFNYYKDNEKNIIKKLEIEKNYRKLKKKLFSWNNSYSDLNLFYNDEGKKLLKYKVLNHYTEEMTLPILIPILNLKSFLPLNFFKSFQRNYYVYDIIGKSFIDENFPSLIQKMGKNNNIYNERLDKVKSVFGFDILNDNSNKIINEINLNQINLNGYEILKYLHLDNTDYYSCCLIKPGLHIRGYIIINKDNFDFIGFPRKINDINELYCSNEKGNNICYGSLMIYKNFYYFNIKFDDIISVYKKIYCFKDDGLEIFTKQNKSYYFEFNSNENNNIKNNNNNDISNKNIENISISKSIRNKIFFIFTNNNVNIDKEYESEKLRYLYKGKDKRYKNIDSIIESYSKKLISKLELLIRLNLIANRSFKDINQYPIFPWII